MSSLLLFYGKCRYVGQIYLEKLLQSLIKSRQSFFVTFYFEMTLPLTILRWERSSVAVR